MWTRVEIKERAKAALHRNYWKIVLVASLLFLLGCGSGGYRFYKSAYNAGTETDAEKSGTEVGGAAEEEVKIEEIGGESAETYEITLVEGIAAGAMAVALFLGLLFFASAAVLMVDIFLLNPLSVGGSRFMVKSVEDVAQVKEIAYGFDHSYKNIVKVMFYKDLYVFLWALVFVIPGIVKMYQYYMVPYLLAEHPDLDYREALRMSRDMMKGNKWKTFVLGLSFILWDFFGAVTFFVGEVLYVQPYRQLTFAALYCELKNTTVIHSAEQGGCGDGV